MSISDQHSQHQHSHQYHEDRERLQIFKSPVARPATDLHDGHDSPDLAEILANGVPQFHRHEEPTLLEIFYDLFFAANYFVFDENNQVTDSDSFEAYLGYFCLLWLTWFLVTAYDVRFVTDSIFERITTALQLGVLVGFAVVAPDFDPNNQNAKVMRTMLLILMMCRATLAVEYSALAWHIRKYVKCRRPLFVSIAVNVTAMFVYLGITFCFNENHNSRVFITWYVVSGAEVVATMAISFVWPVMSFSKTHLIKRVSLLTVMILGDGLINIAKEVVTIVKTPDAWDARTVGLIVAGVTTVYFVFLIYFDWLRSSFHMTPIRQLIWLTLHLPFHLSLILFMQAFTQFIIWGKVLGILQHITTRSYASGGTFGDLNVNANLTSAQVAASMRHDVDTFFKTYPAQLPEISETVDVAIQNISSVPNTLWSQLLASDRTGNASVITGNNVNAAATIFWSFRSIVHSLSNNIFQSFGIDVVKDIIIPGQPPSEGEIFSGMLQTEVDVKTWRRYRLVFAYGYISAGCCLLFMAALSIVTRASRLRTWPIIRLIILVILALGLSLTSLLWFAGPTTESDEQGQSTRDRCLSFLKTPWVLLTIFLVYTIVLIMTHIGHVSIDNAGALCCRRKQRRSDDVTLSTLSCDSPSSNDKQGGHWSHLNRFHQTHSSSF